LVLLEKLLCSRTQRNLVEECARTFLIKKFMGTSKIIFSLLHKTTNVTSNTSCWHHWLRAVERLFWDKWRLVFRYLITSASRRKCCLHLLTLKLYVSTFLQITFLIYQIFWLRIPEDSNFDKLQFLKNCLQ
jgi:hypothetical protein